MVLMRRSIVEASQAGVDVTLFVRGISCIVPGLEGCTDHVRVVSIVGRLLEHSRIYGFGPRDAMKLYLSSADLMTRNMDKRIEIAHTGGAGHCPWPSARCAVRPRAAARAGRSKSAHRQYPPACGCRKCSSRSS